MSTIGKAVVTPFRPQTGTAFAAGGFLLTDDQVERTSAPGMRAFFGIAKEWGLSVEEQMALLDLDAKSTLFKWRKEPPARLTRDRLERISHLLGIYKALRILYSRNEDAGKGWVKKPNMDLLFQGRPALNLMIDGGISGLLMVRTYLDAHRGG